MTHDLLLVLALLLAAFLAERFAPATRKGGGYSKSRAATPWDVAAILRGKRGSNEPDTRGLVIVLLIIWAAAYLGG